MRSRMLTLAVILTCLSATFLTGCASTAPPLPPVSGGYPAGN